MTRRLNDAAAFVHVDAVDCGAPGAATPRAHFNDDELSVVAANEIELAKPATIAAGQDRKPVPFEVGCGVRLPESATREAHSTLADADAGIGGFEALQVERDGTAVAKLGER